MRDAMGNLIPGSIPLKSGTVPAPGAALRAPMGPQLRAAGLPTNASPAAAQALANVQQRAVQQARAVPVAGPARPRGFGSFVR
jgi:hypothetical protein